MAETFDPYHIWLGIPPEEQPPNHYRLLGVRLFEENLDVIASAADRQMGHLRTFQVGQHGALSQQLLNEVSRARVCLLNPVQKAAYDAQQRQRLEGGETGPPPTAGAPGPPPVAPPTVLEQIAEAAWAPPDAGVHAGHDRSRKANRSPVLVTSIIAVVIVAAGAAALILRSSLPYPAAHTASKEERGRRGTPAESKPSAESAKPAGAADQVPLRSADFLKRRQTKSSQRDDSEKGVTQPISREKVSSPKEAAGVATRAPVPAIHLQQRMIQQIEEALALKELHAPGEKVKAAQYLLLKARSLPVDSVERFAYLRKAAELAVEGGDSQLTMTVIDQMAELYEVDAGKEKAAYAERLEKSRLIAGQPGADSPPASSAPKPPDAATGGLDEAYRLFKAKDFKAAKEKLDDLAKEDSDSREGRDYRIELCRGLVAAGSSAAQAEKYFDWCVKSRVDDPVARNNLALACVSQRKLSKALRQFEGLLEKPNPPPEVIHNLNRLQHYVAKGWIAMESTDKTRLSTLLRSDGATRGYQPGQGWQYLSLRHEDGRPIGDLSRTDLEDRRCCFCLGSGRADCRSCNNGSIRQYVNKVTRVGGQNIVARKPVYVTCDDCRGRGTVACASCEGKGIAIDVQTKP